jgi:alkylhydroperoxidase family enzyme
VQLRAGQLIGNTCHTVRVTADLHQAGEPEERITAVASWRDAPYFTDAERVALDLVEAVLNPNPSGERVNDELCARASAHYDHKALWTLTMAIGQMCFFIPVALIGKPAPRTEARWSK